MDALEKYRNLIKELVPWIEHGDWNGLLDHVERTWPIIDILFVWDSLRKKAFVNVLEREEAVLEAILRRNLLSYCVVIGWWGAGAGDKRGTASPLSATPRQLEEAITRNDNAKSGLDALVSYMGSIDAKLTRAAEGADAAEAARDAATANGATLAEVDATTRATAGKVDALIGRGADNEVKPSRMAQLITAALAKKGNHKGVGAREVQRWVQYLKTGGAQGIQPPEGFTLNSLRTLAAAGAFAEQYADAEAGRLRTHMAFNEHDSRLEDRAKRRFDEEQEAMQNRVDRK